MSVSLLSLLSPGITLSAMVYLHSYQQCHCSRINSVAALVDFNHAATQSRGSNDKRLADVGTNEVVAMLSA